MIQICVSTTSTEETHHETPTRHRNWHFPPIPWNKGRIIGPKPPLKLREIWAIRIRLQLARHTRDLALFNLAIDSKLRGYDLVKLQLRDVANAGKAVSRVTILQQKTGQPVRFELTDQTREAVEAWIVKAQLRGNQFLFSSRMR